MLPSPHRLLGALLLVLPTAAAAGGPEPIALRPMFQPAVLAKQQAILGGTSRLQAIAAQQNGVATPLPVAPAGATPAVLPPPEGGSDRPNAFGSTALDIGVTPLDPHWQRVRNAGFNKRRGSGSLVRSLADIDREDQIHAVNRWVNRRIAFKDDRRIYGAADHWATLGESLARGEGDCEDYAIAKMQLLQALGFAPEDLYLTVVRDLARRADHAVLLVRLDGRLLVLDNNTDRILESQEVVDYRPVFTFAAGGAWIHGYSREVQFADASSGTAVRGTR